MKKICVFLLLAAMYVSCSKEDEILLQDDIETDVSGVMFFTLEGDEVNIFIRDSSFIAPGAGEKNIQLEIDGVSRDITEKGGRLLTRSSRPLADLVFVMDNSGSMDDEADMVSREVRKWGEYLSEVIDLRIACVGYDNHGVSGGMDFGTVSMFDSFLRRNENTVNECGPNRTYGWQDDALRAASKNYSTHGECCVAALLFADRNFAFRNGASRHYIIFTNEPNYSNDIDTLSVNNISSRIGCVHTVFSESKTSAYYTEGCEKVWSLSDKTGGGKDFFLPTVSFNAVSMFDLCFTKILTAAYNGRFHMDEDLRAGDHEVKVMITDGAGVRKCITESVNFENL